MTANPFPEWLAEVAADAVIVDPGDIAAEARGNLWSFSLSAEEAAVVTVADVNGSPRTSPMPAGPGSRRAAPGRWCCTGGMIGRPGS